MGRVRSCLKNSKANAHEENRDIIFKLWQIK